MTYFQERLLWLRHFAPVLFVHKPLCTAYRAHSLRIGSWYLCRSCCWLYLGMLWGAIFLGVYKSFWTAHMGCIFSVFAVVLIFSHPSVYQKLPRWFCEFLRFLLGVQVAVGGWLVAEQMYVFAGIFIGVLLIVKSFYTVLRNHSHEDKCQKCPEFSQKGVCSGFALKAEKMKNYESALKSRIRCNDFSIHS